MNFGSRLKCHVLQGTFYIREGSVLGYTINHCLHAPICSMMSHTSVRELSEVSDEHFLDEDRINSGHCRRSTTEIPVKEECQTQCVLLVKK